MKRSITLQGHRTSISLEPEFWDALKTIATTRNITLAQLVKEVDEKREERNLSSALRVAVLKSLTP